MGTSRLSREVCPDRQNVKALKRKASMAGGLENPRMYQLS